MKLRLPTLLCTALLACMTCATTVHADTYLAEGVNFDDLDNSKRFYDGDKGYNWSNSLVISEARKVYSAAGKDMEKAFGDLADSITVPEYGSLSSSNFSQLQNDSDHCWAYTAANMLQYWQTYYGVFAKKAKEEGSTIKHGLNYDREYMSGMRGTQSLKLNKLFYDNFDNRGADPSKAFNWYLKGINGDYQTSTTSAPGYFAQYFSGDASTYYNFFPPYAGERTLTEISNIMKECLGYTKNSEGVWEQTTKGQIMHLDLAGNSTHAITCYGMETDANGDLSALYVVNSDDGTYNLEKVYCKMQGNGIGLYYDEACTQAWRSNFRVTGWSSITTPEVLKNMLAEYENGNLTWMGNLESWTNTAAVAEDVDVLPTDETGWMTYAGTDTEHAGYYNTYYTNADKRGVEFNDEATNSTVNVAEDITVATMAVNNTKLDYTFSSEDDAKTITTGSLSKTGTGALVFDNTKLYVEGAVTANGNSITFTDDASIGSIDESSLVIKGGTTTVRNDTTWTNLKSLAMSDTAKLKVGASLNVAGNISSTDDALPTSGTADIIVKWCLSVGTEGDANTGHVDLAGNISAEAYIKILGDANITGNVTSSGAGGERYVSIGGNAKVDGNITADQGITIGKDATIGGNISAGEKATFNGKLAMTAGKTLTAKSLEVKGDLTGGAGDTKAALTTTEGMTLGGNASNVVLEAQTVTVAEGVTLDSVDMVVKSGEISLTNVTIQGDSSFGTGTDGEVLTLNANGVTFVLEAPPAQTFALFSNDPLTQTQTASSPLLISSSMLEGLDIQGSVTFDLTNWQSEIESGLYDSIVLDLENTSFSGDKGIQVTLGEEILAQMTPDAGNADSVTIVLQKPGDAVPEPTTATLSLLALAALAARRRRK